MTANDIVKLLRRRYSAPEWAFVTDVRSAAGFDARRSADAVAMNLWPSRGLSIHGFEIKVSRSDWLRELKHPEKAEAVSRYCDHWFVVAPKGLIIKGEVPAAWGLIEADADKTRLMKESPLQEPKDLDKSFFAAMFRRVIEQSPEVAQLKDEYERGYKNGKDHMATMVRGLESQLKQAEDAIKAFAEKSGLEIDAWNAGNIGAAVRILTDAGRAEAFKRSLVSLKERGDVFQTCLEQALACMSGD